MEPLADPYNDRQVPSVDPPPSLPLSDEVMWAEMDIPNWEVIRDHLKKEGKLQKDQVVRLAEAVLEITKKEPTLVHMAEPI